MLKQRQSPRLTLPLLTLPRQASKWAGKKPPKKQKRKFQFEEKNKRNSDKARTADDDTDDEGEAFAGRARAVDFREKHNSVR